MVLRTVVPVRRRGRVSRVVAVLVAFVFVVGAAGDGAVGSARPSGLAGFVNPSAQSHPLDVTVALDQSKAVSAVVGVKGGSLKLTTADQTTFRLDIPPAALLEDTEITMTPVGDVAGWAGKPQHLAMVQLEPSGLQLLVEATLAISRPEPVREGERGQLAYDGHGQALRPVLARSSGDGVIIPVRHFSGYGWVWKLLDESYWIQWTRFQQSQAEAQLEAEFAAVVGARRQRELLGEPVGELAELVNAFIGRWYDTTYEPRMRAASRTCKDAQSAATTLLSFWRVLQLAGIDVDEVFSSFGTARSAAGHSLAYPFQTWPPGFVQMLTNICDTEAIKECQRTGDLTRLLSYIRDRTEYFEKSGGPPENVASDEYLVQLCARYEVRFDATVSLHQITYYPDGSLLAENLDKWRITVTVPLRWHQLAEQTPWLGEVVGEATPTSQLVLSQHRQRLGHQTDQGPVDEGWGPWITCQVTDGPWRPWPLRLTSLDFVRHDYDQSTLAVKSAKVLFKAVTFDLGFNSETCSNGANAHSAGGGMAAIVLADGSPADVGWHMDPDRGTLEANELSNWQAKDHPILATKEWTTSKTTVDKNAEIGNNEYTWDQQVRVELVHTPAQ